MKIKKLGLGVILLAGAFVFTSCGKKNTAKETNNDNGDVTSVSTTTTDTSTNNGQSTTTPEPSLPSQVSITIEEIDSKSVLNTIYEDFKKPKLPTSYVELVRDVFKNSLNLDEDVQKAMVTDVDCLSAKGVEIADGEENSFLMDSAPRLSSDEAYIGNALTPVIVNLANYVDDLIDYETNIHNEISDPKYYFYTTKDNQTFFIIQIVSKDGSNKDLIVINGDGVGSYINYAEHDYKFETVLEEKGKLTEDDKEILNSQPYIKYNNDGCQYKIVDYTVTELTIPGSYRTVPFNDIDLNDLDKCDNLEAINLNGSNKYKVVDGVLYNKDQTELLYYPKAKVADSYDIPSSVTSIRLGVFKKLKNLKEINYSTGVTEVRDNEFEGSNLESVNLNSSITTIGKEIFKDCVNLKNIKLPFADSNGTLLRYFQKDSNDQMTEVLVGSDTYYVPQIEGLNLLSGDINENTFLGISQSLKNLTLSSDVKTIDSTNFVGEFNNLESISAQGVTTLEAGLFKDMTTLKEVSLNISTIGDETFSGCTNLSSIDLGNLTSIGNNAFENCALLSSLSCESVTSLGKNAFKGCKSLSNLSFPVLTSLPESAFEGCSITSLSVPNVTTIGDRVFYGCNKLSAIEIDKLKNLSEYAFYNCVALETLNIPLVTKISNYALYQCSALKTLTTATITSVGNYGLSHCKVLSAFDLSKITILGVYAFEWCRSFTGNLDLSSYKGNNSDKKIPNGLFNGCDSIKTVSISSYITTVGDYSFNNCSSLTSMNLINITSCGLYSLSKTSLTSLTFSSTASVTVGNFAFYQCEKITEINLNASSIGEGAFKFCSALKTATIHVTGNVGKQAFADTKNLETFKSTCTTTTFGDTIFRYANTKCALKDVEIASTELPGLLFDYLAIPTGAEIHLGISTANNYNVKDVQKFSYVYLDSLAGSTLTSKFTFDKTVLKGLSANKSTSMFSFNGWTNLEWVSFDSVTTISRDAFSDCTSLKSASFASVSSIGQSAFSDCSSLETFDFGNCTNCGGFGAFANCTSLKSVTGSRVANVGQSVFYNCTSLKTIGFMANITSLSSSSFSGCSSLESFTNYRISEIYGSDFENCTSLKTVNLSIKTIYAKAFTGCTSLTNVNISGVTVIGGEAFKNCTSLTSISFPNAKTFTATDGVGNSTFSSSHFEGCTKLQTVNLPLLTSFGNSMFKNCTSLTSITSGVVTSVGNNTFNNCYKLANIKNSSTTVTSNCFDLTSVTSIPKYAFYNCQSLSYIKLGAVTYCGEYSFYGCVALSTYNPSTNMNLETIGDYAFYGCKKLSAQPFGSIRGASLKTIGSHACEGTALWNIEITDSVTSIGTDAFANLVYINSNITSQTFRVHYSSNTASLVSNITTSSLGGVFKNNVDYFYVDAYNTQYNATTINNIYNNSSYLYSNYYIYSSANNSADLMQLIVKPR